MIELVALNNSLNIIICLVSCIKLFWSYRASRNSPVLDFAKFYFFLMCFFLVLLLAIPGIFFEVGRTEELLFASSYFFVFVACGYFLKIPLNIFRQNLGNYVFIGFIMLGIIASVVNPFITPPAEIIKVNYLSYIKSAEPQWFSATAGGFLALTVLSSIIFFFIQGVKSKTRLIKIKSFLLSGGMMFLFFASLINFILIYLPSLTLIAYTVSGILSWIGLLIILTGINLKDENVW